MRITVRQLIKGIEQKNNHPLDSAQEDAVKHGSGPLLIAAGPGTGKTEVLITRCLKFICCDRVDPASVMLTTFTEKAAKNLEDRVSESFLFLANAHPDELGGIDPSNLRIGTLHGLCNDTLQEYRYTAYQNLRLLDEMESALLIHKSVVDKVDHLKDSLLSQFGYLFGNKPFKNKWDWTQALTKLFERAIEDQVNLDKLREEGGPWESLYQANRIYEDELANAHSCDFSRLLRHFRDFLDSGQGKVFLNGDGNIRLPLTHVLVDEYQDTNPIQESIYLRLCDRQEHNITVVGDDDQALYRFRGGSVECMVGFASECQARWGVHPHVTYLSDNHRSDIEIVEWCNTYITSFPQMALPNVRIPDKPPLNSIRGRTGTHPAVGLIRESRVIDCANRMADLVSDLHTNGIIQDYSQCVLLLRSTRNSARFAGPYHTALTARDISVYNPRSKDYLEQAEVARCLGSFIRIVDPELSHIQDVMSPSIQQLVRSWVDEYDLMVPKYPELADYVVRAANAIANLGTAERVTPATPTIIYRILSHKPFNLYQRNPEMDLRLGKLTRLFESFCSQYGRQLWTDDINGGELSGWWYGRFYYGLCGYLEQRGIDDDEDDEGVCPDGHFPIMTIHQAKGLEFDFVFVGNLGSIVKDSEAHYLESDLRRFRYNPPIVVHSVDDAMWHDAVRQQFVAYSRARYALILVASDGQLRTSADKTASFGNAGGGWVRQNIRRL